MLQKHRLPRAEPSRGPVPVGAADARGAVLRDLYQQLLNVLGAGVVGIDQHPQSCAVRGTYHQLPLNDRNTTCSQIPAQEADPEAPPPAEQKRPELPRSASSIVPCWKALLVEVATIAALGEGAGRFEADPTETGSISHGFKGSAAERVRARQRLRASAGRVGP